MHSTVNNVPTVIIDVFPNNVPTVINDVFSFQWMEIEITSIVIDKDKSFISDVHDNIRLVIQVSRELNLVLVKQAVLGSRLVLQLRDLKVLLVSFLPL